MRKLKILCIIMTAAVAMASLTACTTDTIRGALDIVDEYSENGEFTLDEDNELIKDVKEYIEDKIPHFEEMEEMIDDLNNDVDKALEQSGY